MFFNQLQREDIPMTVIYGGQSWVSAISQAQFHEVRGNSGHTEVHVSYRRNYIDLGTKPVRSWRTNKVHSNLSVKHPNLGCFYIETWSEGQNNINQKGNIQTCCVFRPVNACLRMRSHGRKRSKTFENHEKVPFSSWTQEAHLRLTKKKV